MGFNLWCSNEERKFCNFCNNKGDITNCPKSKIICPITNKALKVMGETVNTSSGMKMTSSQIQTDRKHRSTEHFKKEIYPTMKNKKDTVEHFRKKYNLKKL